MRFAESRAAYRIWAYVAAGPDYGERGDDPDRPLGGILALPCLGGRFRHRGVGER